MERIVILIIFLFPSLSFSKAPLFAIFPFQGNATYSKALWRSFYGEFIFKRYSDLEPKVSQEISKAKDPIKKARKMGIDYVVKGRLLLLREKFLGVYSEIEARGSVEVFETKTGLKIFGATRKVVIREGGIPFSLPGASVTVAKAAVFLRDEKIFDVLYKLGLSLADAIPEDLDRFRFVQVGAYKRRWRAVERARALRLMGYRAEILGGKGTFKVVVGPFEKGKAELIAKKLKGMVL